MVRDDGDEEWILRDAGAERRPSLLRRMFSRGPRDRPTDPVDVRALDGGIVRTTLSGVHEFDVWARAAGLSDRGPVAIHEALVGDLRHPVDRRLLPALHRIFSAEPASVVEAMATLDAMADLDARAIETAASKARRVEGMPDRWSMEHAWPTTRLLAEFASFARENADVVPAIGWLKRYEPRAWALAWCVFGAGGYPFLAAAAAAHWSEEREAGHALPVPRLEKVVPVMVRRAEETVAGR